MEQNNESLAARVQQLERERDDLHKDIEQLCMQQAGPAYLGVATRLHFQRTAALEQDVENLKKKLAICTRENQNLQEELSEAYRIKGHLSDLLRDEVSKNAEAEKQLKFFQGCVAAAFAERDSAIMEAEKAKEKVELMPQELNKTQKQLEELTFELVKEKELAKTLQVDLEKKQDQNDAFKEVIDKFYDIRQCTVEITTDANWEEKCECLLSDTADMWRFQDENDTSTSNYISSLEAEVETLRRGIDHLQNKLRVGMEIESHLKKKVSKLEKKKIISEEKIKKQRSDLLHCHSQCKRDIVRLLDEGYSELKSVMCLVDDEIKQFELSKEDKLESAPPIEETESQESECRDVHVNVDSALYPSSDPGLPTSNTTETGDSSDAFAQALQEKVSTLLLLSQEEERHLLERHVNAALHKKVEELQRNLLQVTNEKVKALMELAQLKQELFSMQEKMSEDETQGKQLGENQVRRIPQEKDWKLKHFLKKSYLTRWAGGSDDAETYRNYENSNKKMDFARMKIENATLKESLGSMEHLLSSIRRLRNSLSKLKELSMAESTKGSCLEDLDQIITETNLLKTALSSSLPVSWSADSEGSYGNLNEKADFVSAAGREMVELLQFASLLLKNQISVNQGNPG